MLGAQGPAAIFMLIAAGSVCVTYTYDKNGNRTAQVVSTIGSSSTQWGAGTFGCFVWSS